VDNVDVPCAPAGTASTPTVDTAYAGNLIYNGSTVYQGFIGIIDDVRVYNRILCWRGHDALQCRRGEAPMKLTFP
jgi:hypothetical protein